jgi:hypothetical protein
MLEVEMDICPSKYLFISLYYFYRKIYRCHNLSQLMAQPKLSKINYVTTGTAFYENRYKKK